MIPLSFNPFMRSRLIRERSRADSAAASCASSCRVSRCTSTSPAFTARPESKKIFSTMPGWSALTVTPWTAVTVPIAFTVADHASGRATVVVTASGGGLNAFPIATAAFTWWALNAPSAPTKAATTRSIRIIRFIMRTRLSLSWTLAIRISGAEVQFNSETVTSVGWGALGRFDRRSWPATSSPIPFS